MGSNGGNDIAALLGVGLGIAAGLKKRKEKKKEEALQDKKEAQGDTMFDLQKQQAELNLKVLSKSIADAEAAGRVFSPEEKALFEEAKAQKAQELQDLDIQARQFDVQKGEKDMASYDSDKAMERQLKEANLGYMGAMTNRMNREPAGGAGSDGVSVNLQRELAALTSQADAFKEIHFDEDKGEWDSEQSYKQWQGMRNQYIERVSGLTGLPMPTGAAEKPVDKNGAKAPVVAPRMGAPRASDALVDKGGERTYGEDVKLNFMRPLEGIGSGIRSGWSWLTGSAPNYVDEKGQQIDVSGLGTEQVKKMEAAGLIKPISRAPLATGMGGYMGN